MKIRSLMLALLVFVMALGAAQAQDIDPCFGLSTDDCAAINEATANFDTFMEDKTSFSMTFDISFTAENLDPETPLISYSQTGTVDIAMSETSLIPFSIAGAFDVSMSDGEMDMTLPVVFVLVDDVFYFTDPTSQETFSVSLLALMEDENFSVMMEEAMSDPEAMTEDLPVDADSLAQLSALLTLPGLLAYERAGDDFTFTVDLAALGDPANQETIMELVAVIEESDPESAAQIESFLPLLPMILDTGTIEIVQSINPEFNIVDNYQFNANFVINAGMLTGDAEAAPATVDLAVNIGFGNFDGVTGIVALENATDITEDVAEIFASFAEGFMEGMGGE